MTQVSQSITQIFLTKGFRLIERYTISMKAFLIVFALILLVSCAKEPAHSIEDNDDPPPGSGQTIVFTDYAKTFYGQWYFKTDKVYIDKSDGIIHTGTTNYHTWSEYLFEFKSDMSFTIHILVYKQPLFSAVISKGLSTKTGKYKVTPENIVLTYDFDDICDPNYYIGAFNYKMDKYAEILNLGGPEQRQNVAGIAKLWKTPEVFTNQESPTKACHF